MPPAWCGSALGHTFTLTSTDSAVQVHAARVFSGLAIVPASPAQHEFVLAPRGDAELALGFAAMAGTLNSAAIDAAAGSLLLHAGSVAQADGGTAVLCGPSGSGKSTLTAVLAGRGYAYITDETVCLDPSTMRITPYRKPLVVKTGSFGRLGHLAPEPGSLAAACSGEMWLVAPEDLGGTDLPDVPLDPRLIVLPTYSAGSQVSIKRLGEGEAAYALGANSSQGLHRVDRPLEALARLVRRAPVYRLIHGDVKQAADAVERLWAAS